MKKLISILLCVLMVVSVAAVGITVTHAEEPELDPNMLYFDTNGTGWTMDSKDKVSFYVFPLSDAVPDNLKGFGAKKLGGKKVAGTDTLWYFDPSGFLLEEGVQYKIIFYRSRSGSSQGDQTYDLYFDTTCLGHVGYCDGTEYENPVDSSKSTIAAFWQGKDASEYGPVLQISSIGNVVGTCLEQGKTKKDVFVDFLTVVSDKTQKTSIANARTYVVDVGTKTEQQLIDDIGAALGLTKDDIQAAFDENPMDQGLENEDYDPTKPESKPYTVEPQAVTTTWSYEASTLPAAGENPTEAPATEAPATEAPATEAPHVHTPGEPTQENYVPATCKQAGGYDTVVYCTACSEELSREHTDIGQLEHTPGEPVQENYTPANCQHAGGYDMVTYCTECGDEISREHTDIGKLEHTPGEAVKENNVPATCQHAGSYDLVTYCTECGDEISRETIDTDPIPHTIIHKDEVPATATTDGMEEHYECEVCGACFTDADGQNAVDPETLVIKAEKVRGDADHDGELGITDVTIIQRYLADYEVDIDLEAANADLDKNGDGTDLVDIIDATLIQRVLAELTTFEAWDAKHALA